MSEAGGPPELFGAAWTGIARAALGADARVRTESHWFRGTIRLACPERYVVVQFGESELTVRPGREQDEFRFGFVGSADTWTKLLTDSRASLNRLVRSGDIELDGDRVGAMQSWRLNYLIIEALSTRSESVANGSLTGQPVAAR